VGWQLAAPGLEAPISVLPLPTKAGSTEAATASVKLELFVDQSICELFLHDGRGAGSAVVTFGCAPTVFATPPCSNNTGEPVATTRRLTGSNNTPAHRVATGSLFSHFARLCIENQLSF
jgi:hypothetical protein